MGRRTSFPSEDYDWAIAISPDADADVWVRVLHCRPEVREGQLVEQGERLGHTIRSRFFCFWTGPHSHVDILRPGDFGRSTKSLPLVPLADSWKVEGSMQSVVEATVLSVHDDKAVCSPVSATGRCGDLVGHAAYDSGGQAIGVIDGGVPHYRRGGVHRCGSEPADRQVFVWGHCIGLVTQTHAGSLRYATTEGTQATVNRTKMRGVSFFLYPNRRLVHGCVPLVLIPEARGGFHGLLSEGDSVTLRLTQVVREDDRSSPVRPLLT